MKRLKKLFSSYWFNSLLIVGLAVLVLYLTLQNNSAEVLQMLKNADCGWLILVAAMVIGIRLLNGLAIKWECNLSFPQYTWLQGVVNAFTGGFFNEITPSATGGQFAQVYIFRKQGIPASSAAGVLWMNFILYQSTMVGSVFLLILLRFHHFYATYSQFFLVVILGFIVNSAVIVGLWAMGRFPKFYTWVCTTGVMIGSKLHLIKDKDKAIDSLNKQLDRFGREVDILRHHKEKIPQVVSTHLLRLMLYYAIPYFCAKALHMPVDISALLDVLALSSFVSMVTSFVPLPGASGGSEAVFVLMFSTIFGRNHVSAVMLIWRFMTYYFDMALGGIVFLIARNQKDVPTMQERIE